MEIVCKILKIENGQMPDKNAAGQIKEYPANDQEMIHITGNDHLKGIINPKTTRPYEYLKIDLPTVSEKHGYLFCRTTGFFFKEIKLFYRDASTNGTYYSAVREDPLSQSYKLHNKELEIPPQGCILFFFTRPINGQKAGIALHVFLKP